MAKEANNVKKSASATGSSAPAKGTAAGQETRGPDPSGAAATETATTAEGLAYQFSGLREREIQREQNSNLNANAGTGASEAAPTAGDAATATSVAATAPDGAEAVEQEVQETGDRQEDREQEAAGAEEGALPPEAQIEFDKRVGKEVAKRKRAEEENALLKAQLAEAQAKASERGSVERGAAETANGEVAGGNAAALESRGPKAGSAYEGGLRQQLAVAQANLQWARQNPGGGTVRDGKGNDVNFSAEQAMQIELKATEDIGRLGFKLEQFQEQNTQSKAALSQAARGQYPELFVKGSPANQLAQRFLSEFPQLLEIPGGDLALGDIVSRTLERIAKASERGSVGASSVERRSVTPAKPTPMPRGGGVAAAGGRPAANGNRQSAVDFSGASSVEGLAASFAKQRATA